MKEGLSSILLDVDNSTALDLIQAEFGLKGFAVIVKLWQKIAKEHGYYSEFTEDVLLLFADKIKAGPNNVSEILGAAFKRGIFDKSLYDKYSILTSADRQEKFFVCAKRRKKIKLIKEYLLVKVDEIPENADIFSLNVNISEENVYISETSKGKQRKVKQSKVKESSNTAAAVCFSEYEKYIGLVTPSVAEGIDYYISKGVTAELINRLIQYSCEQNKRSWQYINAVILGNLTEGILTVDDYNRHQAERTEKPKRTTAKKSKFNNYTDTNKPDYSNFSEQILKDMLGEE